MPAGSYIRHIKFSPSKSSPSTLIREFRKVRSRKNWLQRELYNSGKSEAAATSSNSRGGSTSKRKVSSASEKSKEKRLLALMRRFDEFKSRLVHACDYVEFVHAILMKLSPTDRETLRKLTVMQQEQVIAVRRSFGEMQQRFLNEDFAIDM